MANTRARTLSQRQTMISFEGVERNILSAALIDSPYDNQIPYSILNPQLSPDEQIIQLRGRKKVNWSPSYKSTGVLRSPLKTPTKKLSAMRLRNSPRKRLMPDGPESTPEKEKWFSPYTPTSTTKKIRFDDNSTNKMNPDIPLAKLLNGMNNNQLIDIILDSIKQAPHLENHIRLNLPTPDLKPMEERLNVLKRTINKSLPKTRLFSKSDSSAYARASTHIDAFKKCLAEQLKVLSESEHWNSLVDFCLLAWNYAKGLPIFDSSSHNATRKYCFKLIVQHLELALKNGSIYLGEKRLCEISLKVKLMAIDYNDTRSVEKYVDFLIQQSYYSTK